MLALTLVPIQGITATLGQGGCKGSLGNVWSSRPELETFANLDNSTVFRVACMLQALGTIDSAEDLNLRMLTQAQRTNHV